MIGLFIWSLVLLTVRTVPLTGATLSPSGHSEVVKLKVGQNATLTCPSKKPEEEITKCQWLRNGQPATVGRGMSEWTGSWNHGDCNLLLIHLNLEYHSGTWQCFCNSHGKNVSTCGPTRVMVVSDEQGDVNVQMVQNGALDGQLQIKDGYVTVRAGTIISANCSILHTSPNATITWEKTNGTCAKKLSSLIKNTQQEDATTWLSEAITELDVSCADNHTTLTCSAHDAFTGASWVDQEVILEVSCHEITEPPAPLKLEMGENATLTCRSSLTSEVNCHWFHNGKQVNVDQDIAQPNEYEWETSPQDGDCSLRLISVKRQIHQGAWMCVIENTNDTQNSVASEPVQVTVNDSLEVILTIATVTGIMAYTSEGTLGIMNGSVITAKCTTSQSASVTQLRWSKMTTNRRKKFKATQLASNDVSGKSSIQMTITDKDHLDKLVCTAYDADETKIGLKMVPIEVYYPPQYSGKRSSFTTHPHELASFKCPLRGNPKPTYQWSVLDSKGTWSPIGDGDSDDSVLSVSIENRNQAGFYNCTATNIIMGQTYSVSELIYVHVLERQMYGPKNVVCNFKSFIHDKVTLFCPTTKSVTSDFRTRWYFQGENKRWVPVAADNVEGDSLTLYRVNASQAGLYKCIYDDSNVKDNDACSFIFLSLTKGSIFDHLKTVLGLLFCVVGLMLFIGLLAFVIQISKMQAVQRVEDREAEEKKADKEENIIYERNYT